MNDGTQPGIPRGILEGMDEEDESPGKGIHATNTQSCRKNVDDFVVLPQTRGVHSSQIGLFKDHKDI